VNEETVTSEDGLFKGQIQASVRKMCPIENKRSRQEAVKHLYDMDVKRFYWKSEIMFKSWTLREAKRLDLSEAHLEEVALHDSELKGADLRNAYLQGADLQRANLWGACLQEADLRGIYLHEADLQGADLQGANLSLANLRGVNLWGANLWEADLRGAKYDLYTKWPDDFDPTASTHELILIQD
jgi:hypothetical protein